MSIRGKKIIKEMRRFAAENPDYYVENCVYLADDGEGHCIVGKALKEIGVIDLKWAEEKADAISFRNTCSVDMFWRKGEILVSLSQKEKDWIQLVQKIQDGRGWDDEGKRMSKTWANAVAHADKMIGALYA